MKKLQLLLVGLILAVGGYAQVYISGDVLQPAMFDTTNSVTGLTENLSSKNIVLELIPVWNTDSLSVGVFYADSTSVKITDYVKRCVLDVNKTDIVKENGYNFITTDKDLVMYWIINVYNQVLKAPSLQSIKNRYNPHY